MAAELKVLFNPQLLPTAAAVLFEMPSQPDSVVLKNGRVRLTNTHVAGVQVTLYCDAPAVASGAVNDFFDKQVIAASSSVDVDLPTMGAGWTLRGFAGVANVISMVETGGTLQYPSA